MSAAELACTANEFFLAGRGPHARTGVLLVHGLTGTPNEMRVLGKALRGAGFTVYAVQLAGHCGSRDDLLAARWQDWTASVHAAAGRLRTQVDRLLVMGLSMGAVLALELAAARPDWVDGVGALSTTFRYDGWSLPAYTRLSFLLRPFRALGIGRDRTFMEQPPYGIKDEALRKRVVAQMQSGDSAAAGLPGNPWYAVVEMLALARHVRRRLRHVRAPCLVMHASDDDVSSTANARLIERRVRGPVELVLLHDSHHMITIDRDRRIVAARAIEFAARIARQGGDAAAVREAAAPPAAVSATCREPSLSA